MMREIIRQQVMTFHKGPFKFYVSKEVGGWGQKKEIFADLQHYLS